MTGAAIVAEWTINRRERVRISLEQFKGVDLINIRKWFEADDGSLRPAKAGIALNVKYLPQIVAALAQSLTMAKERGLVATDMPDHVASGSQ